MKMVRETDKKNEILGWELSWWRAVLEEGGPGKVVLGEGGPGRWTLPSPSSFFVMIIIIMFVVV